MKTLFLSVRRITELACALLCQASQGADTVMEFIHLTNNRLRKGELPLPDHAWKACTAWSKVFAVAAIPAFSRKESAREPDADFHDGWQPIRLRQAAEDGER